MRRVLICGATGFIGRNLAERLAADERYSVSAVHHRRPPFPHTNINWLQGDLTRREDVARLVQGHDVILQAAATTSGVRTTVAQPSQQIVDNAVMNSYIFAAAQEQGAAHVVFPSCTVMLASSESPQREEDYDPRVPPHPIYEGAAHTKLYMERLCAFYARLGHARFSVFRHSNVYGPHDKFDLQRSHVFGATITKVLSAVGQQIVVWGTGEERRDLLHVDDLVDAFIAAMEKQTSPFGLYNIGRGYAVSVKDLVGKVIRESGRDLGIVHDESKPTVKVDITLDCSRAARELGWTPKVGLDDGIRRTIAWWKENPPVA